MWAVHKAARRRGRSGRTLHIPEYLDCTLSHAMTGAAHTAETELGEGEAGQSPLETVGINFLPPSSRSRPPLTRPRRRAASSPTGATRDGTKVPPIACTSQRRIYRHDPVPTPRTAARIPHPALKSPAVSFDHSISSHAPLPLPLPCPRPRPRPLSPPRCWPPLPPRNPPCACCDSFAMSMISSGTRRYLICREVSHLPSYRAVS